MEENVRKKMKYFDGKTDLTFREIKIWKAFLNSLVEAHSNYYNHLKESANILNNISMSDDGKKSTGESTRFAADKMQEVLAITGEFHRDVLGDFQKYIGTHGPFSDFLECTDIKYQFLKKTAAAQLKEHHKLEQAAEMAWKYYMRRVKKQSSLEAKLLKTLTEEQLKSDNKCLRFHRKTNIAKSKYENCFLHEERHRALLIKRGENVKREFLKQEKEKLDKLLAAINTMLSKQHQLTAQGINHLDGDKFELGPVRTKAMAASIWDCALTDHVFPEQKEEDTKEKELQNIDNTNISGEDDSDDEDEDVDDDDEEYVDAPLFQRPVESLRPPNAGLNNVLEEIMESLDHKSAHDILRVETAKAPRTRPGSHDSSPEPDQASPSASRRPKSSFQREKVQFGQEQSISLHRAPLDSSDEEYAPKTREEVKTASEKVEVSSDARRQRREAKAESEDKTRPTTSGSRKSSPDVTVGQASRPAPIQEKTTVYGIADWKKRNPDEISIRVGMKIKMTVPMNNKGLAYGYKKTKFGIKKYGFFPASLVSCVRPK